MIKGLRNEGVFTPPSTRGTVVRPSNVGGAHWGGLAVDPEREIAIIPVNRHAAMVQLMPREGVDADELEKASDRLNLGFEYNEMEGTPYVMRRRHLILPNGMPCTPPPFGALVAVDLRSGDRAWEVPLGTWSKGMTPPTGSTNLGGPIATAGGLVFIAATRDRLFRAFDSQSGAELWSAPLPGLGRATPMTYRPGPGKKQYVAIVANSDADKSGRVMVFALPDD
jgi:quinoprotein glucose dehydrogenase